MRAWRVTVPGAAPELRDIPDPALRNGSVLVKVHASVLVSYLRAYLAGKLPGYPPPAGEFTPGTSGVGVIEAVGPQVYGLRPGQRVLMTGYATAAENVPEPARALLSMTAGPAARPLLDGWPHGTLADRAMVPASTVTPVPDQLSAVPSSRLAVATRMLVPYGGLRRARLAAGETVIVTGATGTFGRAGVHVARALGAATVVGAGRNPSVLATLAGLDRVVPVQLTGDVAADTAALRSAAGGRAACALDLIGGATSTAATRAALDALGRGGRLVLMGSASAPLTVDYTALMLTGREIIGQFMYPPQAAAEVLALAAAGLLDLDAVEVAGYPLAELETAVDAAAEPGGPLVVVSPDATER
ncbi:MAG TPA: zinc-binding alcohol dehydrogenase family protein [Streptosporangiaceae bacterium]|nr:zinc-binding alcohol dehydrogenase family protein [Streptosporangiaceae bacterium]